MDVRILGQDRYRINPKYWDRQSRGKNVNPDQTPHSGSTLFAAHQFLAYLYKVKMSLFKFYDSYFG